MVLLVLQKAEKLKVLDLSRCMHLTRTPDFSGFLKLERLILEKCVGLAEIDSSIGQLKCLVFLNLNFCGNLRYLPQELGGLPALTELLLDKTSIRHIPDWWGNENLENPHVQISPSAKAGALVNCLTSLLTLSLAKTPITYLPSSIGALTNLKRLYLNQCFQLNRLPDSIKALRSLTELDLTSTALVELPDSMESLENLNALKLSLSEKFESALPKLPESLTSLAIISDKPIAIPDYSNLINLKLLLLITNSPHFSTPSELVQDPMPGWIGTLSKLEVLTLGHPRLTDLSPELGALSHLKTLQLFRCCALDYSPHIPSSVTKLHIGNCFALTTLDISNLKNLSELYVIGSSIYFLRGRLLLDSLLECMITDAPGPNLKSKIEDMMSEQHGLTEPIYEGFTQYVVSYSY